MHQIAQRDAAIEIQRVSRTQDDAGGADQRRPGRHLIGAGEAEELPDEARRTREADRRHGEQQEEHGISRHIDRKAAVPRDLASMQPVVNDADAQEQCARHQTVAEHHDHRAFNALLIESEQADGHDRHVGDRRIGDQLLHVRLNQRDERSVDDRDCRQSQD